MGVSAVIPAYNEEKTIYNVVSVLKESPCVSEVIVVSDGSTDRTAQVARNAGAKVITMAKNIGKGGAMMAGVSEASQDVILFLDADLLGLTPYHVQVLVEPVLNGEAHMTVGIFEHGRKATDLAQYLAPFLSGQRVIQRELLTQMPDINNSRYGVEVALTKFINEHKLHVKEVMLADMSHVMKEEKMGLVKGFMARVKMYWEIAKYFSKDVRTGTRD